MDFVGENCGVAAALSFNGESVLLNLYWALLTLNHRGHQSYGILTFDGDFRVFKDLGLVADLDFQKLSFWNEELSGSLGIAHVRYATSGDFSKVQLLADAQPCLVGDGERRLAIAYNGNIVNVINLRRFLLERGVEFRGTSDAEVLAHALLNSINAEGDVVEGVKEFMGKVDGSYSVVGVTGEGILFAFRDPHGIRPLVYGFDSERKLLLIASESVALNVNGVKFERFLSPGELVIVDKSRIESCVLCNRGEALCAFEYAYFARPDSILADGRYVYEVRRELGRSLARRYSDVASRVDVIVPVPQTAVDAAYGFHEEAGKPIEPLIVRHRYVKHRAFIMSAEERDFILSRKYNILLDRVDGKRIALIDDSIVRGDTLRHVVRVLKGAGAVEVHVFSTFPKIISPCFYGIDMATFHELVGFNRSDEEVAEILGADSVNYQTVSDFCSAVGHDRLCLACVTGNYPTPYAQKLADMARSEAFMGRGVSGRIVETLGG
ncbi:MAG: amidophosphoribosyltransferase [archaeon GB-1867-005]|nr:amidophosphoribosyltransferase [Candidatus Culexmicrobium cathedralense]